MVSSSSILASVCAISSLARQGAAQPVEPLAEVGVAQSVEPRQAGDIATAIAGLVKTILETTGKATENTVTTYVRCASLCNIRIHATSETVKLSNNQDRISKRSLNTAICTWKPEMVATVMQQ